MARRYRLRLPLFLLLLGGLWLLFGTLVAPPLLTAAYEGRGVALLNDLFAAYPSQSLDFFLGEWMEMVIYGALAVLAFAGWTALLHSPRLEDRFVGTATPGTIGAIRVLVCFVLLVSTLWEHLPSTAALPRELVHPMGVMTLLNLIPGFEAFTASPVALGIFQAMTATLLVLGMVGWRTRWVLPMAAVGYLILGGLLRQYAWFYHTGLLALYLLIVLAMVPSQDGWSLDRLRKLWR
ncbi:MAG: hypothetical protein GVY18_13855, partial [Bacteroidetes bacterium]|nr:hypothetical protein [Bacteroidota bacterium]